MALHKLSVHAIINGLMTIKSPYSAILPYELSAYEQNLVLIALRGTWINQIIHTACECSRDLQEYS